MTTTNDATVVVEINLDLIHKYAQGTSRHSPRRWLRADNVINQHGANLGIFNRRDGAEEDKVVAYTSEAAEAYSEWLQERQSKPLTKSDGIYILEAGPFHKIGITNNVLRRVRQLSTGCMYPITVRYFSKEHNNVQLTEKQLHTALADYRMKGEWFDLPEDISMDLEWFIEMLEKFPEEPDIFRFD